MIESLSGGKCTYKEIFVAVVVAACLATTKTFAGRGACNGIDALRGRILAYAPLGKVADVDICKVDILQDGILKGRITKHSICENDVCQIGAIKSNTIRDGVGEVSVAKASLRSIRLGELCLDERDARQIGV